MNYDVSVIIPVYNTEKFLGQCIDSIIHQKGVSIEIVIVDDGSTDNSMTLCREYASSFENIRIFSQENQGPSKARELGLLKSRAPYVLFMDSDDYIAENSICRIMDRVKQQDTDIYQFNFAFVDEKGVFIKQTNLQPEVVVGKLACTQHFIKDENVSQCLVNKIFKKEIFRDVGFSDFRYSEDFYLMSMVAANSRKIVTESDLIYSYRQHPSSAVHRPFSTTRLDAVRAGKTLFLHYEKENPALSKYAARYIVRVSMDLAIKAYISEMDRDIKIECCRVLIEYYNYFYRSPASPLSRQGIKMRLFRIWPKFVLFIYSARKILHNLREIS